MLTIECYGNKRMITAAKTETQPKIFYGWYIVMIAFMANFMSVGTGFYLMNAFMEPLCEAHGWTRTDISLAPGYGIFFGLLAQMVYGTIVNRMGVRILMLAGSIVSGMAFYLLIQSETLGQFYFYFIVLFVGNAAYGGIVAGTAVNNWFIAKRGRAMGLATAGVSFSGAVLPLLAMVMILWLGIEQASLFISLLVILVRPVAWLVVKDWPEEQGLRPDGIDLQVLDGEGTGLSGARSHSIFPSLGTSFISPGKPKMQWPIKRLVRNGTFWRLGLAYALLTAVAVGVMSTYPVIIAHIFGRQAFPFVIRFASLFLILQMAGYLIAGQSFDRTGSYNLAYAMFFVFDVIAAMLIWSIPKTKIV